MSLSLSLSWSSLILQETTFLPFFFGGPLAALTGLGRLKGKDVVWEPLIGTGGGGCGEVVISTGEGAQPLIGTGG